MLLVWAQRAGTKRKLTVTCWSRITSTCFKKYSYLFRVCWLKVMNFYQYNQEKVEWQLMPLSESSKLGLDKDGRLKVGSGIQTTFGQIIRYDTNGKVRWALIPIPTKRLKINGSPAFSLTILSDKDEICHQGQKMYFTQEQPARVVDFLPEKGQAVIFCPRCKLVISGGKAVLCPKCRLWYHEQDERKCWSYDARCVCGHPTARGLSWKPAPTYSVKCRAGFAGSSAGV